MFWVIRDRLLNNLNYILNFSDKKHFCTEKLDIIYKNRKTSRQLQDNMLKSPKNKNS